MLSMLTLAFLTNRSIGQTVTLNATLSGKVTSADVKTDGDLTNICSTCDEGYIKFDLSSIPGTATILSATLKMVAITPSTSSASTVNKITTTALDASTAGAGFYSAINTSGTAFTGSWSFATLPNTYNMAINAAGITALQGRLASGSVTYGVVRGSTNVYTFGGYNNATTSNQPQLVVTYGFPCSGAPVAGTVSGPVSACSGVAFNLTNTGATAGTNIKYSWQSSASAGGPWTNLNNTSTLVSPFSTSQTAVSYYRLVDTCTTSGQSAISNVIQVTMSAANSCYCTPTYASGCSGDNIASDSLGTLQDNGMTCVPVYDDRTSLQPGTLAIPSLNGGSSAKLKITFGTDGNQYNGVWIDFNQNGIFEASEYFTSGTNAGASGTVYVTINVPAGALAGNTRMRIRGGDDSQPTSGQACGASSSSFGSARDYLVNIIASSACSGQPSAPVITGPAAACSGVNFTMNATGYPTTTGVNFAWQSAASAGGPWANIAGQTAPASATVSQTATTFYRLVDTCINGNQTNISNVLQVTLNAVSSCYCAPTYASGCSGDNIASDSLGTLQDNGLSCTPVYEDRTPLQPGTLAIPSLNGGSTATLKITFGTDGNQYNGVWIDFNQNGIFEASEYFTSGTNAGASGTVYVTINVPAGALAGNTRMRIRGGDDSQPTSGQACGASSSSFGSARDYLVNIIAATPCSGQPSAPVISGPSTVISGASFTLNGTGYPTTTGVNYAWQSSAGAGGPWANIAGQTSPASATVSQTVVTYYRLVDTCTNGNQTNISNVLQVNVTAPPPNDLCANAINLTVSNGFCSNPVLGTLLAADSTAGLGTATCQTAALEYDVWYKATVPASGNLTVQTSAVNTTVTDLVLQAYSGTCGALTPIGCDDDGNPDPSPSALHSKLGLTGRTPGEVIYYRVMPYSAPNQGAFAICAFDTSGSVMPLVSVGIPNACKSAAAPVTVDSAYKYTWASFTDASGNVIAQVYPNGSVLGSTNVSFYLNSGPVRQDASGVYYLDRNITIIPTTQPSTTVTTRLFFRDAELAALSAATGGTTTAQLNSTKTTQTCASSAAVASGGVFLAQVANSAYSTDHSIDLNNSSYSTFYLHPGTNPIPVTLLSFTAQRTGKVNLINWSTSQEINTSHFVLERSNDSRNFTTIATVAAAGNSSTVRSYIYTDNSPVTGINYYRLQMVDKDNNSKYSWIRSVRNEGVADVSLYPNPVNDVLTVSISADKKGKGNMSITDISGKVIYNNAISVEQGSNNLPVNLRNTAAGAYIIKIQLSDDVIVKKFSKL